MIRFYYNSNLIWRTVVLPHPLYVITSESIFTKYWLTACSKIVSQYDQEIPQSQTTDNPVAPRGRAAKPSRDTRKTN